MCEETVAKKPNQKPTNNKFSSKGAPGLRHMYFQNFNGNLLITNRYVIPREGGTCLHQLGFLKS